MRLKRVTDKRELQRFYHFPATVYQGNSCHRATEETLTHLLVDGPTEFHKHASVTPYLFIKDDNVVGRCAFIYDSMLPEYLQVGFFEALPNLPDPYGLMLAEVRKQATAATKIVVGMNGHLNYGAGILLDNYDKPPVFGLPYTPEYYPDYFTALTLRSTVSFRFATEGFVQWGAQQPAGDIDGITVRTMDMQHLREEVARYTHIDNNSFTATPYWSPRPAAENYELFHPFRHLMKGENMLFAEKEGKPLGFLLWYPDFNELVGPGKDLGIAEVLRYRFANPIKSYRFTEIALLPEARRTRAVYAMIRHLIPIIQRYGYTFGEGGFIFEGNIASMNMTRKFMERAFGTRYEPYRRYGIFEGDL